MSVIRERRGRGTAQGRGWTAQWEWEEWWTAGAEEAEESALVLVDEIRAPTQREGKDFRKQQELRELRELQEQQKGRGGSASLAASLQETGAGDPERREGPRAEAERLGGEEARRRRVEWVR